MGNRIISISRQFGSGGHEVAVKTADLLGIRVYERELIRLACEYGELSEKTLSPSDEKATNPYLFQTVHEGNHHVLRGKPTSEVLFALQSHEIRRMSGGNVQKVLVGREIAQSPAVLMTAYAVRGLDINTSYTIYNLLTEQKMKGVAVVYVGEDLDVLLELCDRIVVLCGGQVSGVVDARKTDKREVGALMTLVRGGNKDE